MAELIMDVQGTGHDISVDPSAEFKVGSKLKVRGDGCTVHIGPGVKGKWDLNVSRGGKLLIGRGSTCESGIVVAQEKSVVIGEDCMFSFSIEIRTTDTHAIYDVKSGERVNADRPVEIGDHVWLGKQAVVLKGASIGSGSVLGTRSVLSGSVPPLAIAAGVPARVVREGATWTRRIGKGILEEDVEAMKVLDQFQGV
ncbi:transferase hexapeptide repeat containing protein [Actinobacteria bacterium OK074]|nr:transferase hexapeptide repeat containing protein [Actinobacteria bacterium OK074]